MQNYKTINYKVLLIFAPILIIIGILGFVIPPPMSVTSGAPAYNIFHILFGIFGLILVFTKRENLIRGFNIGFGLIDLYQAAAYFLNLYPKEIFRWTSVDTILHVVIGAALVFVGFYGLKTKP